MRRLRSPALQKIGADGEQPLPYQGRTASHEGHRPTEGEETTMHKLDLSDEEEDLSVPDELGPTTPNSSN